MQLKSNKSFLFGSVDIVFFIIYITYPSLLLSVVYLVFHHSLSSFAYYLFSFIAQRYLFPLFVIFYVSVTCCRLSRFILPCVIYLFLNYYLSLFDITFHHLFLRLSVFNFIFFFFSLVIFIFFIIVVYFIYDYPLSFDNLFLILLHSLPYLSSFFSFYNYYLLILSQLFLKLSSIVVLKFVFKTSFVQCCLQLFISALSIIV